MLDEFQFINKQGSHYIGDFIGATACLTEWVDDQVESWVRSIKLLSRAAKRFPQTSFAALTRPLQTEWTYLQRVVPDVALSFAPIEEALAESFLPALFGGKARSSKGPNFTPSEIWWTWNSKPLHPSWSQL